MEHTPQTIYALSSGRGAAAIAVMRLSGPRAHEALESLIGGPCPPARRATRVRLRHPHTHDVLDDALVLAFKAPHSATGEDMAELHVHGGVAVVDAVLAALRALAYLVMAEPGAFTRRAFENGKLDLAQVEGLADLIAAETEAQRRQALRQFEGALSALYERWRQEIIHALACIEADIDFAEGEDDVPSGLGVRVRSQLLHLRDEMAAHLQDGHRGERLRTGWMIALTGAPNVGKSSLLNALARRDVAIVSPQAGTTRDSVEVHLNLRGYPVTLVDTAGLRDTDDAIEAEGIRRARLKAEQADGIIHIRTAEALSFRGGDTHPSDVYPDKPYWDVINKIDLHPDLTPGLAGERFYVSATTGAGLEALLEVLGQHAAQADTDGPALTRARYREALLACRTHLAAACDLDGDAVLVAEELRLAMRVLGRITGRVDVEDVLDVIFSSFCIGK